MTPAAALAPADTGTAQVSRTAADSAPRGAWLRARLEAQTRTLANRIAEVTGEVLDRGNTVFVLDEDGASQALGGWVHRQILPAVAAQEAAGHRAWVAWWLQQPAPTLWRYAVITGGARVPITDLRESIRDLQAQVSRWLRKTPEIEAAITVLEITLARESNGDISCHPHINLVYRPMRRMSRDQWTQFLSQAWQILGAHWQDCGKVNDAREVVKYITKVEEKDTSPAHAASDAAARLDALTGRASRRPVCLLDLEPHDLVAFADALHNVHRVRYRGGLANARAEARARGERPRWWPAQGWHLVRSPRRARDEARPEPPPPGAPPPAPRLVAPVVSVIASPTPRRAWVVWAPAGPPEALDPEVWRLWDREAGGGEGRALEFTHARDFCTRIGPETASPPPRQARDPSRGPPLPPPPPPDVAEAAWWTRLGRALWAEARRVRGPDRRVLAQAARTAVAAARPGGVDATGVVDDVPW